MHGARLAALPVIALGIAALLWVRGSGSVADEGPAVVRPAPEPATTGEAGVATLSLEEQGGPETGAASRPRQVAPTRVPAAEPPPPADPTGPAPDPWVMGVLTDADGWALPGAEVRLRRRHAMGGPGGEVSAADVTAVTDRRGGFLFEGHRRSHGGTLVYGQGLLLTGSLSREVDRTRDWQVLRLPPFEEQVGQWTVEVVDEQDVPMAIARVSLELVESAGSAGVRWPWPHERTQEDGLVVQSALPLGTWRMAVTPENALAQVVDWEHTDDEHEHVTRVVVPRDDMGSTLDAGPSLNPDGSTWVDPGSGLLEWLPEDLVTVGEPALNRHFAQTLRFGPGPIRSARLTVRLRAMLHNASNDGLYLEHTGGRKFAWSSPVAALTGGTWKKGASRTVRLDLTALPRKEGGPLDLRPWLEDGVLDVVVQDDTTIEDIRIRVLR